MTRPDTTARVRRDDGTTFESAVLAACALHERELGVKATICYVNLLEPGLTHIDGEVEVRVGVNVPLHQFWAYRDNEEATPCQTN